MNNSSDIIVSTEEINNIKRNAKLIYNKYNNYIITNNDSLSNEKFLNLFWDHFFADSNKIINLYKIGSQQRRIALECISSIQMCLEIVILQ